MPQTTTAALLLKQNLNIQMVEKKPFVVVISTVVSCVAAMSPRSHVTTS